MLNIVIPMAGAGSRFAKAGYVLPKPLIPVHDKPMIQVVINNIKPSCEHRFIFICQSEHMRLYDLAKKLNHWVPGCEIIGINGVTEGAACTVLLARHLIDSHEPLMIANSDQFVECDINNYLAVGKDKDGIVMTMKAYDPKWSFAELDSEGHIVRIVEKEVISDEATVGIYNFAHGSDFVQGADAMIAKDERVNGEFYVAPVYNGLISNGGRFAAYNVGCLGYGMHGLGTPADLEIFLTREISRNC